MLVNDASIGTDQLGKYLYVVDDSDIVNYRHIDCLLYTSGTCFASTTIFKLIYFNIFGISNILATNLLKQFEDVYKRQAYRF